MTQMFKQYYEFLCKFDGTVKKTNVVLTFQSYKHVALLFQFCLKKLDIFAIV
jgi:hypothetical protein